MYSSCIEKSQIIQRLSYLNSSTTFTSSSSRAYSVAGTHSEKKELRKYPSDFVEQIENKSDNRYHHNILSQSKVENNPNLASPSKIFGQGQISSRVIEDVSLSHRKNQSLGSIGTWKLTSPEPRKTIIRKLDEAVPMSELIEIARILDCSQQDEVKQLSRGYVNELFQLAQTIDRKLRNISK